MGPLPQTNETLALEKAFHAFWVFRCHVYVVMKHLLNVGSHLSCSCNNVVSGWLVCLLHHSGPYWNISTTIGWIGMKLWYGHSLCPEDESYWRWWLLDICSSEITSYSHNTCKANDNLISLRCTIVLIGTCLHANMINKDGKHHTC